MCASGNVGLSGVSGWSSLTNVTFTSVFYKPNCGAGETAPTVTGGVFVAGALAEFSGVALSSVVDQDLSNIGTTSPNTMVASVTDLTSGELWAQASNYLYSMAATKTTSHAFSNGTAQNPTSWNNDATSTANHFRFSYCITTSNASVMTVTDTFTTTNLNSRKGTGGAFELPSAATGAIPPGLLYDPYRNSSLLRR